MAVWKKAFRWPGDTPLSSCLAQHLVARKRLQDPSARKFPKRPYRAAWPLAMA